jgi:hypothetical protein
MTARGEYAPGPGSVRPAMDCRSCSDVRCGFGSGAFGFKGSAGIVGFDAGVPARSASAEGVCMLGRVMLDKREQKRAPSLFLLPLYRWWPPHPPPASTAHGIQSRVQVLRWRLEAVCSITVTAWPHIRREPVAAAVCGARYVADVDTATRTHTLVSRRSDRRSILPMTAVMLHF